MTICGADLVSATQVLFNGKHPAALYEWNSPYFPECWWTTVPIVEPLDDVNGPLVVVTTNGVATSTTDFTAAPFNDDGDVVYNRAWLPDGKYFAVSGPYFGAATDVTLDGASAAFRSASLLRLLIPVSEFDALTHTLIITTPYGVFSDSSVEFVEPLVTNMILPDSPGSFELTELYADGTPGVSNNAYRARNGFLLPGNNFLVAYDAYVDTGNAETTLNLASSSIIVSPTLISPNRIFASGTLTSVTTGRLLQWSTIGVIQPYSQEYRLTTTFTDTAGLGLLKLRTRLDEDVWSNTNDMMAMIGAPGQPDFAIMTPDSAMRVGFGAKGVYTTTAGLLENAAWDGFAAGNYYDLKIWIEDHSLNYEKTAIPGAFITGTTSNIDLATDIADTDTSCLSEQAEAGWYSDTVYLTEAAACDVGVSMSWTADPSATTAKITLIMLNLAADPLQSTVAGLDGIVATVDGQSLTFAPTPFISSTREYTDPTTYDGASAILTPTLSDAQNMVSVMQVTAPGASAPTACTRTPFTCPLAAGVNRIDVVVLSANAQESISYSFYVTRTTPTPTATPTPSPTPTSTPVVTPTPTTPTPSPTPGTLAIGNVWPKTGVPAGGMPVSLFGSGFTGAFSVTVDGQPVDFTVLADGRIDIAAMPAGVNFTYVDVVVTGPSGSATAAQAFLYVEFSTGEVPASGGVITTASGATVTVPALGSSFVLTYTPISPPAPTLGNVLMHVFRLDASLNWVPVTEISRPLTVELPVDPSVVPSGERPWLYVWTAEGSRRSAIGGRWSLVPAQTYDPAAQRVTVPLDLMRTYALSTMRMREYWFPLIGPLQ